MKNNRFLVTAFKILYSFLVTKIAYKPISDFFERQLEILASVVDVISDADPDNNSQLKNIWDDQKDKIIGGGLHLASTIVSEEVNDETLKAIIIQLIEAAKDEVLDEDTQSLIDFINMQQDKAAEVKDVFKKK